MLIPPWGISIIKGNVHNIPEAYNNLPYDPYNGNPVAVDNIYRGPYPNNQIGPYVSQFFWLNITAGVKIEKQIYSTPRPLSDLDGNQNYAIGWGFNSGQIASMLNGATNEGINNPIETAPKPNIPNETIERFIYRGRDLANWVSVDPFFQGAYNTFLIMCNLGVPINPDLPQFDDFTTSFENVGQANVQMFGEMAFSYAFYWKWLRRGS